MRKKLLYSVGGIILGIAGILSVSLAVFPDQTMGAFSKYGLPGIYNSTDFTLTDGQGSAIAVDSAGKVQISTSSVLSELAINNLTADTLTATSATIGTLAVSVAEEAVESLIVFNSAHTATTTIKASGVSTFGSQATSHSITSAGSIIANSIEANGASYIDGTLDISSNASASSITLNAGTAGIVLGGAINAGIIYARTDYDHMLIGVGSDLGNQVIIGGSAFRTKDYDHAIPTDFTLFGHSSVDPDTDNTQWWSLTHNQTDAVLGVGKGGLIKQIAGTSVADDGTITLATGVYGLLDVWVSGEYMRVYVGSDGAVTSIYGSANTAVTDSDTDLCVYDGGTGAIIKNRLGSTKTVKYIYSY